MKQHRFLLLSTSALTFVTALGFVTPAKACLTVSSNTTINDSSVSCITWNSSNISITNTGTITSGTPIVTNGNNVGTLTNNGDVASNYYGAILNNSGGTIASINNLSGGTLSSTSSNVIYNQTGGSIGVITNSGLITGASAFGNNGTVGTIINTSTGEFSGGIGLFSNGLIGTIMNSGTISGGGSAGIRVLFSSGGHSIGLIENLAGGLISDLNYAINNVSSTIGTINNAGHVYVSNSAGVDINNSSSIGTIINSGTIDGAYSAAFLVNQGSIDLLQNNLGGLLTANKSTALMNNGYIGTITNSGTITMQRTNNNVISNTGTVGTISNSNTLSGQGGGIANTGTITQIINNSGATLSAGTRYAITNSAAIGTITNYGTIIGATTGISNTGSISVINNNASGSISGHSYAISSSMGTIGTISNAGTISASGDGINNVGGTIATIINQNTGVISSGATGIVNFSNGFIQSVINNGNIIASGTSGVWNANGSTIITLTNNGTITSHSHGLAEFNATIQMLNNTGLIHGTDIGIITDNTSSIGATTISTLANSGTLSGAAEGIANLGGSSIGTIINSGLIEGTSSYGLMNANVTRLGGAGYGPSYLGTLTNTGTVMGHLAGIMNSAVLGMISNSGTINSNSIAIDNGGGTISSITNSGQIEGPSAIFSSGTILSALANSGTIGGTLNVNQALTITGGSIGGLGTLTGYNGSIGTITTNTHDLTFDTNAYQLLDDNINVGAAHTVFNNGLIRINTTHSITGNYSQAPGGTLVIGVTDPTHYGQLIVSGAATMTNGQVLIAPTSGSLINGETLTIVQAATAGTSYTGVVATANGFTTTTSSIAAGGNEDLIITIAASESSGGSNTYMQKGALVGSNGSAVGAALDQLETSVANGGNVAFVPVLVALNTIGAQQGVVAEGAAIKQLAPGQLSASVGATNLTAMQTMTVIGQHQQNLRSSGSSPVGRAAGSEYTSGALWMQVSGGFANSTTAGAGYHQSYYGITFGADDRITKNALLGLAVGWSHNNAQGANDLSGDSVTTSTPELMGYGTYRLGQAYLDGMLGVGYNMFTQSRSIGFLNSVASSSYDGMQYMGNVEAGYDFAVTPRTTMTPLAGFNAVRTDTNSYTETGAGPANTSVGHQIIDSYATLLGGRLTTAVPTLWGSLLPEVRLAWEHDLNHSPISSNANLGGVTFATSTPRSAQDGAELTLAATLQHTDALSLRAEYDGDLRSDFQSHTGQLKGSWKF